MEPFSFLGYILASLDKLSQKTLREIVPDLEELLTDPADYLNDQEITIHPWRRWASAVSSGLIIGFGVLSCLSVLASMLLQPNNRPGQFLFLLFLLCFAALVFVVPFTFILIRIALPRSRCILGRHGVRFVRGATEVICPWGLFSAAGQPVVDPIRNRNRMRLPIAPSAIDQVEARTNDAVVAQGLDVKTRQFRISRYHEAIIESCYQLDPHELGWLLLQLGCALGLPPEGAPALSTAESNSMNLTPVRAVEKGGWLRVGLTRLAFPAECCDCGVSTSAKQRLRAVNGLDRVHVDVSVPVCELCQENYRRRYRKAFWKFTLAYEVFAACGGFALGTWLALRERVPDMFPSVAIVLAILTPLCAPCFLWFFRNWPNRWASPPVRIGAYNPQRGTVALRFRRPEYGELLLRANQG
jgi:hypothetical protein